MLTGTQAFAADDPASVIAAVLERDPEPVAGIIPGLDPALDWTLARCLAKSPSARWQDAADLASQLRWLKQSSGRSRGVLPGVANRRGRPYAFAAAAVGAALVAGAAYWAGRSPQAPSLPAYRFELPSPDGTSFAGPFAVSPDGRQLAFTAIDNQGRRSLWVRSLEAPGADVIENTAGAAYPFWSPDSQSIAFFADRKLQVVELATGTMRILSDAGAGGGGTWNKDGVILFGPESGVRSTTGLLRVSAAGGEATPVTQFTNDVGGAHAWPHFLPDGRHYLYSRAEIRQEGGASTPTGGVYVGVLGSNEVRPILTSNNADAQSGDPVPTHRAMYAAGYLFYVRGGRLMAQPFDAARAALVGDPVRIADSVEQTAPGRSAFHVSETGLLVYRHAASRTGASTQLTWFDRSGREMGRLGDAASYRAVAISPLGQYVVGAGAAQIVRIDVANGTATPLPVAGNVASPVWSPNGAQLAFTGGGTGGPTVVRVSAADGSGQPEIVLNPREQVYPNDWSADGRVIVGTAIHAGTGYDVFALDIGSKTATHPIASPFHETDPDLSPNGQWLAYAVNGESKQWEVFIQPFGRSGGVWRVSRNGGRHPRWSVDGRELFYVTPEGALISASVESGPSFRVIETRELFRHPALSQDFGVPLSYSPYDVVSDAQRFLIRVPADAVAPRPIVTIMNWPALLER
jgi:Tol biopolymer transport system component